MLLILEGLDKCGKTTFAQKFIDCAEIIHSTKHDDAFIVLQNAKKVVESGGFVILDRSFLSEMTYGPVYRNENRITHAKIMRIKKLLSKIPYAILYFSRPDDTISDYDSQDEFEKEPEKLMLVKKLYEQCVEKYKNVFNIYEIQYK